MNVIHRILNKQISSKYRLCWNRNVKSLWNFVYNTSY